MSDNNKRKENRNWKGTWLKKKKRRMFSVIVVLQVFPSISDLLLFRKEQAGL